MKQWKKYVGYDIWDQACAGQKSAKPGPIDNSNLLKDYENDILMENLIEGSDYFILPQSAWNKLTIWYELSEGSIPIARKVVEYRGLYAKRWKVEVYLFDFRLCLCSNQNEVVIKKISKVSSVAELDLKMKETFSIDEEVESRVWLCYRANQFVLLSKPSQTLADAGVFNGQTIMLELRNKDGTWPRK